MEQWKYRMQLCRSKENTKTAWMLTPKHSLIPIQLSCVDDARQVLWATSEADMVRGEKWSIHPCDWEYKIFTNKTTRDTIFMAWNPLHTTDSNNINIPAARMLLEQGTLSPPIVNRDHPLGLMQYFQCLPADHVVLFKTNAQHELLALNKAAIMRVWPALYQIGVHYAPKPYENLMRERYNHASQALVEYEDMCRPNNILVRCIIERYMNLHVGPVTHWDKAQLTVLTAATALQYAREWTLSERRPWIKRSI